MMARKRGGNANTLRRYWENKPTKHGKTAGIGMGLMDVAGTSTSALTESPST